MFEHVDDPPETWAPMRRAANALASPIQSILRIEAASGIVLFAAATVALLWANLSPATYEGLWHVPIGGHIGAWTFDRSIQFWINDGAMTVFFLLVGLEIRREIFQGDLASVRQASLPLIAAAGGMVVPAIVFVALNAGRAGAAGWAIPMATDIAFAVGVLTLLGSRVSGSLRVLLLSLAVIDDIGAILVIALFYGHGIAIEGLGIACVGVAGVLAMRSAGTRTSWLYAIPGIVIWSGFVVAGIHPTIAGVLLGLMTPVKPWFGASGFAAETRAQLDESSPDEDRGQLQSRVDVIHKAGREAVSPVDRLIHVLHPWVAYAIMPLFALANAGVIVGRVDLSGDAIWLLAGVIAGLVIGKPLGIAVASLVATKLRIAASSRDLTRSGILLVGLVGGIGFTMSLFIAQLAFPEGALLDTAKLGILVGSLTAIVVGLLFGRVHAARSYRANIAR
jgi:Na+:H+ antiporter, NhaA family